MQKTLRRFPSLAAWLLLSPAALWLFLFFIAPLFIVVVYSFLERGTYGGVIWQFTIENIRRVLDPLYLGTFLRSVYIASHWLISSPPANRASAIRCSWR